MTLSHAEPLLETTMDVKEIPVDPRSCADPPRPTDIRDDGEEASRTSSGTGTKPKGDNSGEGGNETDVEDEDGEADDSPNSGEGLEGRVADAGALISPSHAMYPFPNPDAHRGRPPSSAEVLLSSATSSSSLDASDREEADDRRQPKRRRSHNWPGSPLGPNYRPGAVPPRARRIGALGISVHSDSDPDNPNVSGLDSFDRRVEHTGDTTSDTRATDLGVSVGDLRQVSGAMKSTKSVASRKNIAETTFRGVVDELAEQNRMMRDRLKRYEAARVPVDLKRNRLFEVRFFDGLSVERRAELENFLSAYVQNLARADDSRSPSPTAGIEARNGQQASAVPQRVVEEPGLAGPSYSGLEPPSASGTGEGMQLPPSEPQPPLRPRPEQNVDVPFSSRAERAKALEVVSAIEQLFEHSLLRAKQSESDAPDMVENHSNESYFANLLSKDFLSRGFVYLNLALTMAQIHRFNVTVSFVQRAIAQCSDRLELSADRSRVRWKAPSPRPPSQSRPPLTEASVVANAAAAEPEKSDSKGLQSLASRLSSNAAETESQSNSGSGSGSSNRQPSNILAQSKAPSTTTAQTSAPSSGRESFQKGLARPRRPTAAVLQPMHYFRTADGAPSGGSRHPSASAPTAQGAHAGQHQGTSGAPALSPALESVSSTGSAGQVLSATNLRAHNQLQASSSRDRPSTDGESGALDKAKPARGTDTGTLVFYRNGDFCTDLTKEQQPGSPPAIPEHLEAVKKREAPVLGLDIDVHFSSSGGSSPEHNDVEMTGPHGEGLQVIPGKACSKYSGTGSHGSSLDHLQASGMTETIPSDLFTLVVRARQVRKRPRHAETPPSADSNVSPGTTGFPFFPPDAKRPRLDRSISSLEVISLEELRHQVRVAPRYPLPVMEDATGSSDEAQSPEGWTYGQVLSRANLMKHGFAPNTAHPRVRPELVPRDLSATPSPPHDDYLISLAAPSHAWAPAGSGFHSSHRSGSSGDAVAPKPKRRVPVVRLVGSPANGSLSTGDERPISLDELIGMPYGQP